MRALRPRVRPGRLLALVAAVVLTACQTTVLDPSPDDGRIRGTLGVGATEAQRLAPRSDAPTPTVRPEALPGALDGVLAGEVIVRFEDAAVAAVAGSAPLTVDGVSLAPLRDLAVAGARLYRTPDLDAAATAALARRLASRPDVRYAEPNRIVSALQTTPSDALYPRQWHYDAIGLPEAWTTTTGDGDVVVAVLDTGILFRPGDPAASHPDLTGRVLPGYDFVSDAVASGDGDGRDPDPYDDDLDGDAHGTHVAGTIGARTNDGSGVAGVDWAAGIVPVRVLGVGGAGTLADVIDGAYWAAGLPVGGVPANPNPAHVINLSLGGPGACGELTNEAFATIAATSPRRAVVVVAAGNEGAPVAGTTPASCANVITVGATEQRGFRAWYSNYGPLVDVMAPGGDLSVDRDLDGFPDGVLSLARGDGPPAFGYAYAQGTSMAAPHVAGVVALMKALEPDLTYEEARALLVLTAAPLTAGACGTGAASDCGAGLVDAAAALQALLGGSPATPFTPDPLEFGSSTVERSFTLTNATAATVDWAVIDYYLLPGNPGAVPEGVVYLVGDESVLTGTLGAGASEAFVLGIDRSFLTAPGPYQIVLAFDVDGVERGLTVRFALDGPSASPMGPTSVLAFTDERGTWVVAGGEERAAFFDRFDFPVPAGDHTVVGWTDQDGDGAVGPGDFLGTYPGWVRVAEGAAVAGVDIILERVLDVDATLEAAVPGASADALRAALERALPTPQGR